MLLKCPCLKDAKVSHDWGTNIVIIQGKGIVRTILVIKKLGVQTKSQEVLMCYDFHSIMFNEEEDMMFVIELDLFSIGTIILTHISLIFKLNHVQTLGQ